MDTCGLTLRAIVHSASIQAHAGAKLVPAGAPDVFPQVELAWVDGGHVNAIDAGLVAWAAERENPEIVAVPRNADVKGFQALPRRRVTERTFPNADAKGFQALPRSWVTERTFPNADAKGFRVLPRRWVTERTFSWPRRCRRSARDYERKTAHTEAAIKVAMIRLKAARLAGETIEPRGPIETEAAHRLANDLKNE